MICIYGADCTDFSNNGFGAVLPQSCVVTETLNGQWELELVHPIDNAGHWTWLSVGNILRAPVPAAETPRVKRVAKSTEYTVDVYKVNISGRQYLRAGMGTGSAVISLYPGGTLVTVLSKENPTWYEVVAPDGNGGFMYAPYLQYVRTEKRVKTDYTNVQTDAGEPKQMRDQPFRIYRVVPDLDKVTVYARHIFYDLMDNMVKSLKPSGSDSGEAVVQMLSNSCLTKHNFNFASDLDTTADEVDYTNQNPIDIILGENGIVDKYKAELCRDWFDVYLMKRVGYDTNVEVRHGKNLLGVSYDVDESNVVTRIMPTGEDKDGNIIYLPELYIDSSLINAYPHPRWIHLDVTEAKESREKGSVKTIEQCYEEMRKAVRDEYENGCDMADATLTVEFLALENTAEYADYKALRQIFIGDSVWVSAPKINIAVAMRMTEYTYNCLTKQYESMTLGTITDTVEGSLISARQIAAGSIGGAKIALNSIGAGQIVNGSVGSLQIGMAAINTAHIVDASITSAKIAKAAIDSAHIGSAVIDTANIKDAAINSAKIADAAIESAKIGDAQITTAHIQNGAIQSAQIGNASITSAKIADATIDGAKIAEAAIITANIKDANITTAKIADAAVTNAKIDFAAVESANIGEAAITSAKIQDAAVVTAKIQDLAVTGAKIANATINSANISDAAITNAKIADATIDSAKIALGAITTALIDKGAIGTAQIADGSITDAKIVELTANKINAGTLSVERLIISGNDQSVVYALNNMGDLVSEHVDSLDGGVLTERTVTADKIVANAITANEIASKTITANEIVANTITGDEIAGATITGTNIKAGTLTTSHVSADFGESLNLTSNESVVLVAGKTEEALNASATNSTMIDNINTWIDGASVQISPDSIINTVTNSQKYEELNSLANNTASQIGGLQSVVEQNAESFTASIRSLDNRLSDTGDIGVITTAVSIHADGVTIGKSDSAFKTNISNTEMSFMDGNTKAAYISNKKMFINEAQVETSLQLGRYVQFVRPDGSVDMKWV